MRRFSVCADAFAGSFDKRAERLLGPSWLALRFFHVDQDPAQNLS